MKKNLKNSLFALFITISCPIWAQFDNPSQRIQTNVPTTTAAIRLSVFNLREIIAALKTAPVNQQANAFAANYNNNQGTGSVNGCGYNYADLQLIIQGTPNNPTRLFRQSCRFFEENGRVYGTVNATSINPSTKVEVSVNKSNTAYTLNWVVKTATNTVNHSIVLSPTKMPCNTPTPTPAAEYMTVKGRFLTDICGNSVILRGVNVAPHNWGYGPLTSANEISEIKKTGANTVRLAWYTQVSDPNQTQFTLQNLDNVLSYCLQNQLVAIVDLHDLTTKDNAAQFQSIILNWWKRTDVVAMIKKYEKNMIINIANEYGFYQWAGGGQARKDAFETLYKDAITQLRGAGIRVPLMIDAPDGGNAHEVLLEKGQSLLNHDPLHNIVLSAHTYWARFKYNLDNNGNVISTKPNYLTDVQNQIAAIKNSNLCFVLGEVAIQQEGNVNCQYDINDVCKAVLSASQTHSVSWLAWMWHYDFCPDRQVSLNRTATSLSPFGQDIVNNSSYGLKVAAKPIKMACN
ncbi:MAG: cellulase family glycosylhydrolase [Saprospiraceae bacterium]|nr:cellulase family glycosylhydrolase [Saprospiraceae bacterium]